MLLIWKCGATTRPLCGAPFLTPHIPHLTPRRAPRRTWCGACKALRPQFAASAELRDAAGAFAALVNAADDEEPAGAQYAPDGGYIPRVLFLSPRGDVITADYAQNAAAGDKYRYFHSSPATLATAMRAVSARAAAEALAAAEPPAPGGGVDL